MTRFTVALLLAAVVSLTQLAGPAAAAPRRGPPRRTPPRPTPTRPVRPPTSVTAIEDAYLRSLDAAYRRLGPETVYVGPVPFDPRAPFRRALGGR